MINIYKITTWLTAQLELHVIGLGTATLIGAGIAAAATGATAGFAGIRGKKNREAQEKYNAQQQANWEQQFNYQKYLNENQYQIQAKDQIAAGINPVTGAGGQLNSFSGQAGGEAATSEAPQLDISQIANAISQYYEQKFMEKENAKDRQNAKEIAEINANATKHAADTSAGASISNAELAALTAKEQRLHEENQNKIQRQHEKEMHKLDNHSKEQIADWTTQMQVALQNARQAWEDSNDHRIAQEAYERMIKDVQLDYEAQNYLAKQQVSFQTKTGETRTMSIQDAIDYLIYDQAIYDTSAGVRTLNELRETARTLGDLFSADRESLYNRNRTETTRRRSRD